MAKSPSRVRLRRGLAIYQKADSPYWWIDASHGGKRRRQNSESKLRRDAETQAWALYGELVAAAGRPGRREGDDLALLAGADRDEALARGVGARQIESIERSWGHVCRVLGADVDPSTITYDEVLRFVAFRRREGARGQSIAKETQALKRGLRIARRRGSITALPEDWPTIRQDPPNRKQRGQVHPIDVISQWLTELRRTALPAWRQADVAIRTGLRAEELRAVTWEWVEAAPDGSGVPAVLRIPAESAKTRRERIVGLTPGVLKHLNDARAEVNSWTVPLLPGNHRRAFKAATDAIGHPQTITLRDLRHCHATWSAQGTGDAAATQAALGHTDLRTTQRYLSTTITRTASAAVAVGEALGPVARPKCHDGLSRWPRTTQEDKGPDGSKTTSRPMYSKSGGKGTRTPDPLRAKQVLSQLSYAPTKTKISGPRVT